MRYISEVFTIANTNGQSTHTSAIDVSSMTDASVQAKFSDSSAAGTLKIQVSNDPPATAQGTPTNWSDVTGATVTIASGALAFIPSTAMAYTWMQAVFTSTGGAGTIAVRVKTNGY